MAERRHGSAFDQAHIVATIGPPCKSRPGKRGTPAKTANQRLQKLFDHASQTRVRADAVD